MKNFLLPLILVSMGLACKCPYFDPKKDKTEKEWFVNTYKDASSIFLAKRIGLPASDKLTVSNTKYLVIKKWKGNVGDTVELVRYFNSDCHGEFKETMVIVDFAETNKIEGQNNWKPGIVELNRCSVFPRLKENEGGEEELIRMEQRLDGEFGAKAKANKK